MVAFNNQLVFVRKIPKPPVEIFGVFPPSETREVSRVDEDVRIRYGADLWKCKKYGEKVMNDT
jgi:hypothetical protein